MTSIRFLRRFRQSHRVAEARLEPPFSRIKTMIVPAALTLAALLIVSCSSDQAAPETTPTLSWASYLGGTDIDDCDDVAVDAEGRVLLACHCTSNDFAGSTRAAAGDGMDGYVVKLDPQAGRIVYVARQGASEHDATLRVAVDPDGNAYATGVTMSHEFPTTSDAIQPRHAGGEGDGFLVKLDPQGRTLFSTYFGGSGADYGNSIAVDPERLAALLGRNIELAESAWRGRRRGSQRIAL